MSFFYNILYLIKLQELPARTGRRRPADELQPIIPTSLLCMIHMYYMLQSNAMFHSVNILLFIKKHNILMCDYISVFHMHLQIKRIVFLSRSTRDQRHAFDTSITPSQYAPSDTPRRRSIIQLRVNRGFNVVPII